MNLRGPRPLDPETAEQLLKGHPAALGGWPELAGRFAAVSAAPFASELAGEDAAIAAFRAAAIASVAPLAGRTHKLLTFKAAAVALAVVASGGIALAAATGTLPNPLGPKTGHSTGPSDHPNGSTPSPSLAGLCTAYLAGAGAEHGKALQSPAFTALVTAAGGADKVDAYCAGVGIAAPGSGGPTAHPTGQPTQPSRLTEQPHPTSTPAHHPGP